MEREVAVKVEPAWLHDDTTAQDGDPDHERVIVNPLKLEPELVIVHGVKAEPHSDEDAPREPEQENQDSKGEPEVTILTNVEADSSTYKAQVPYHTPIALESNTWLSSTISTTETAGVTQDRQGGAVRTNGDQVSQLTQQESQVNPSILQSLLKLPENKCSTYTQAEHNNRFTQTENPPSEYSSGYLEMSNGAVMWKSESATVYDAVSMQHQGTSTHMYANDNRNKGSEKSPAELPYCYNVNILQKVHLEQVGSGSGIVGSEEGCYRFEVAQPFGYSYALVNQMSLATATFKCEVCGLVFPHQSLLSHHKLIHNSVNDSTNASVQSSSSNEHQHKCDVCGVSFNLVGELRSHKRVMHKKNGKIAQHAQSKCCDSCGVELGKFIKCECCQDSEGSGNIAVCNSEGEEHGDASSATKCRKCNGPGANLINDSRTNSGDKLFHCKICNAEFSRYSSLWSHRKLHTGERPFKCETCGLAFAKPAYLKNHSRVHTGEKPYKCSICGMQFSQSPHLKNHERIHSGERPYQCEFCDKTFARHSTLWNHRRIHTGEKPYRCHICGTAFNQATHLKNHFKVHSGEKPHRCDVCEVSFADKFTLKRHRTVHEKYTKSSVNPVHDAANNKELDNASTATNSTSNNNLQA